MHGKGLAGRLEALGLPRDDAEMLARAARRGPAIRQLVLSWLVPLLFGGLVAAMGWAALEMYALNARQAATQAQLADMSRRQDRMDQRQDRTEARQGRMERQLIEISARQGRMEERQDRMEKQLTEQQQTLGIVVGLLQDMNRRLPPARE